MILQLHIFATLFMLGLVWVIQIVHYPLFLRVGASSFVEYEREHIYRISFLVIPVMLIELVTGVVLAFSPPVGSFFFESGTSIALLFGIWMSTMFVQHPAHARLEGGFDSSTILHLVRTNWIRTALWSARGVGVLSVLG